MDKVLSGFIDTFMQEKDISNSNKRWSESEAAAAVEEMRKFLDHLQGFMQDCFFLDCVEIYVFFGRKVPKKTQKMLRATSSPKSFPPSPSIHNQENGSLQATNDLQSQEVNKYIDEDEMRNAISAAIRKQIEIEIYFPCSTVLGHILDKAYYRPEKDIRHIIHCIVNQPQSFYGISVDHISPSSWENAVSSLKDIRSKALPFDRIECLLSVAKDIPRIYKNEHFDSKEQQKALGADDILPVFIYILVRAQIPSLLALNQELQAFCDPERRLYNI